MHIFTLVVFLVAAAGEDEEVHQVAPQAEARDTKHQLAVDFCRVLQPVRGLNQKPDKETPDYKD